jgi:hypothetical protein
MVLERHYIGMTQVQIVEQQAISGNIMQIHMLQRKLMLRLRSITHKKQGRTN